MDNNVKKIKLSLGITPLHKLEEISRETGVDIYLKRDDLNGLGMGGNKLRKLEYILGDAREKGARVLITYGGIQTNHGRMTAAVAAKAGMKSCLILKGKPPVDATGNLLLDELLGSRVVYIDDSGIKDLPDYDERLKGETERVTREIIKEYESQGEKVYIVPMGGSSELGALGYVDARYEIEEQLREMEIEADYMVTAYGSVGTYGGLLLGNKVLESRCRVLGINILHDLDDALVREHTDYINRIAEAYHLGVKVDNMDLLIDREGVGAGYNTPEEWVYAGVERAARSEGIFFDFCYTGKAFARMLKLIEDGSIEKGSRVVFIHTGGIPGIFSDIHGEALAQRAKGSKKEVYTAQ